IPVADIDDAAFGFAAAMCDVQRNGDNRFKLNGAFVQQSSAMQVLDAMRTACQGVVYREDGQIGMYCDVEQAATSSTFNEDTNARDTKISREGTLDRPTKVTVQYPNSLNEYLTDEVSSVDPSVDT